MEPAPGWAPFTDDAWVFEFNCGGHRVLAEVAHGQARLHSRNHVDVGTRFPALVASLSRWAGGRTVLDGEICVLGDSGLPAPALLHRHAVGLPGAGRLVLRVFDLLVLEGEDWRSRRWQERCDALKLLPLQEMPGIELQRRLSGRGVWLHAQACALGLPGVVAKHRGSPYVGGRSHDWRAIACAEVRVPTGWMPSTIA